MLFAWIELAERAEQRIVSWLQIQAAFMGWIEELQLTHILQLTKYEN